MADEISLIKSPILDQLAVLQNPVKEEKRIIASKLAEKKLALYYLENKFPDAVERFKQENGDIIIPDKEIPSILKRAKRYYGLRARGTAILGVFSGIGFFLNFYFLETIGLIFLPLYFVLPLLAIMCGIFSHSFFYILRKGELPPSAFSY